MEFSFVAYDLGVWGLGAGDCFSVSRIFMDTARVTAHCWDCISVVMDCHLLSVLHLFINCISFTWLSCRFVGASIPKMLFQRL